MTETGIKPDDIRRIKQVLIRRHVPALLGDAHAHSKLVGIISDEFEIPCVSKSVSSPSVIESLIGTPKNPVSFQISALHQCIRTGGMIFLKFTDYSERSISSLKLLETFLPRGNTWTIPDYINFKNTQPHGHFYLVLSFPGSGDLDALPASITSRLEVVSTGSQLTELPNGQTEDAPDIGPGSVLTLMRFGIPEYEQWYKSIIVPTVSRYGKSIRLTKELADWQSSMILSAKHADLVIMDLSHDEATPVSPNVLWEINSIWNELWRDGQDRSFRRERLLFCARVSDVVRAIHDDDFVYVSELPSPLLGDMPTSAPTMDDLLGFKIRLYDPNSTESLRDFQAWLDEQLRVWVQDISPPVSNSAIERAATEGLASESTDSPRRQWWRSIRDRDFGACSTLLSESEPPDDIWPWFSRLMASVGVSNWLEVDDYWSLLMVALRGDTSVRRYFVDLLRTRRLLQAHYFASHFRENLWFAMLSATRTAGSAGWMPSREEFQVLLSACDLEPIKDIQDVAMTLLAEYIPEPIRRQATMMYLKEPKGVFQFIRDKTAEGGETC